MSSSIVSSLGTANITLAIGQMVSVYGKGITSIYQIFSYPNHPNSEVLISSTNDSEVILGPFAAVVNLSIRPDAYGASYDVGQAPVTMDVRRWGVQPEPDTTSGNGIFLSPPGRLKTGIMLNHELVGVTNIRIPLPQVFNESDPNLKPDDSWDFSVICTEAGSCNFLENTGSTIVGNPAVATGTSATFRFRKVDEDNYIMYRLT